MSSKFKWKKFKELDVNNHFFDSLKKDYPEFTDWYKKKILQNESALVHMNNGDIGAFIYLKEENEEIELNNGFLPSIPRLKIGTLKLSEDTRGIRLGEGALGVALWQWQDKKLEEIYVTTFPDKKNVITLVERYGFKNVGSNKRGELIF